MPAPYLERVRGLGSVNASRLFCQGRAFRTLTAILAQANLDAFEGDTLEVTGKSTATLKRGARGDWYVASLGRKTSPKREDVVG